MKWRWSNGIWLDEDGNPGEPGGSPLNLSSSARPVWPLHSEAAGVDPSQSKEAYDQSVRDGVPTTFDHEGCAVFESRNHRKAYLKTIGMHDKSGGYGD